jgi:DNA mismatch endonuclease (patch repair protein)
VDGCFWHGCRAHSPRQFHGPNATLWKEKIDTNRARDLRNNAAAESAGWSVVRVWECEIRRDVDSAAVHVINVAQGRS